MKKIYFLGGALLLPFILLSKTIPYQEGWPVFVNGIMTSPIKIADIDNDGEKEVIYGDGSDLGQSDWWLYVKTIEGSDKPGWPQNHKGSDAELSIFDFNDDGKMEILSINYGLRFFDTEGDEIWFHSYDGPIFQNKYLPTGTSIEDLDNDGTKEIVVTCYSGGAVFVFEPDGSVREGWPVIIPPRPGYTPPYTYNSASIGDIDNDGLKEIIVGIDNGTAELDPSQVFCFKPNGNNCPGFPVGISPQGYRSKAVLIDIDNDSYLEIIIGKERRELNIYRYDGSLYPGYPLDKIARKISTGDINLDGNKDIIFVGGDYLMGAKLSAYNILTKKFLPNFPISPITDADGTWYYSSPYLLDLSDAFGEEIATGAGNGGWVGDGKLFAFDLEGNLVEGFPSEFLYHRVLGTGCSVDDLDGDGDVEICCGSRNNEFVSPRHTTLFCWDSPHPWNRDMADWMMDGFDLQNTGRWRKLYHIDKINSHLEFEGCTENPCILPNDGKLYAVTITAKRKFAEGYPKGQDVRLSRTGGCGEYEGPVYDNGDGTYTRFFRAPTNECQTKIEGWVNEFKLEEKIDIKFSNCLSDLGDVNLNGIISSMDASEVLKSIVLENLDPMSRCRADVNLNGGISSMDASLILQCSVGLCTNLPEEFLTSCQAHNNCP